MKINLLTATEYAKAKGLHPDTVTRRANSGKIDQYYTTKDRRPFYKIDKHFLGKYEEKLMNDFIKSKETFYKDIESRLGVDFSCIDKICSEMEAHVFMTSKQKLDTVRR